MVKLVLRMLLSVKIKNKNEKKNLKNLVSSKKVKIFENTFRDTPSHLGLKFTIGHY